jgi:drug/metabolite transporter (DMT)-like permease
MPLAALGVLAFSFSTPMTKLAVRHLDVVLAGMGRAVPPAIVGAALLRATRQRLPSGDQIKRLVFVGVGVVIGFPLLTAWALHRVPAAHGSLAIGAAPLATAGFGMVLARERPSVRYWAASAMAVAAVLAYVIEVGGGTVKPADGVLLVAVVLVGLGYAHGGLLGRELGGWQVICWALVLALPVTVPVSVARLMVADLHGVSASAWAGWAYTAGVSMFLGFFAWYGGLARAGIARAGQLQLVQPVLALVWGWPLLGEDLDASAMVCALIVIAAVAWGRRAPIRVDWRQRR